jgi:tetratricopeptide (TPR) repeat protein
MSGVARAGIALTATFLALALALAIHAHGIPDPFSPAEDLCAQAKALESGRLLEQAGAAYAKAGDCPPPGSEGVEAARTAAADRFATAAVYAAASVTEPKEQPPRNSKRAIAEYVAGLETEPFATTANLALTLELNKDLVAPSEQCETASTLAAAGLLGEAGVALANGLKAGESRCDAGLRSIAAQRRTAAAFQREATALKGSGQLEKARRRYASALRANANLESARTGLESSLDDQTPIDEAESWLAGVPDTVKGWLDWLIPLAIGLLLLALVIWMAVRELSARLPWARDGFERLGSHPGFSFFRNAAVPQVSIEDFDGKGEGDLDGPAFSTMLSAAIRNQVGREPAFPLDRIGGSRAPEKAGAAGIADLLAEVDATKTLGSLVKALSKLFRRRTVVLSGRITPDADQGAGVLLTLESSGRGGDDAITLWERAYDPKPGGKGAARWLRLVPAASVWARWQLAAAHARPASQKTDGWRSDALLQSAEAWLDKGQLLRAQALYVRALEADPTLLPAARSIAQIEVHNGEYAAARKRLEHLRSVLAEGGVDPVSGKPRRKLWPLLDTASLYTLVLALAYPASGESNPSREAEADLVEANARAGELVAKLARSGAADPDLRAQLRISEGPSVVVLAALQLRQPGAEAEADRLTAVRYAREGGKGVREIERDQLRQPLDLKPWELIHGYVEKQPDNSVRTHYNLACYYTTLGTLAPEATATRACFDLALAALKLGLAGAELAGWAAEDPSLKPLHDKDDEKRSAEFKKILENHTVTSHDEDEKDEKDEKPAVEDGGTTDGVLPKLKKALEELFDPPG